MPKRYHVDPESVGLHRLGHAELAHNGQRCGTCDHAEATGMHRSGALCLIAASFPEIQREWKACAHYAPRAADDHAARLYRPEKKHEG